MTHNVTGPGAGGRPGAGGKPRRKSGRPLSFDRDAAISHTQRGKPAGCLLVHGASNCSKPFEDVQRTLAKLRGKLERAVREKIEEGLERGELPSGTDAGALAAFYISVTHGMSTQAQDGAGREKLLDIAAVAMKAWPQTASAG